MKRVIIVEGRSPAVVGSSVKKESRGDMIKPSINLQDLRRKIYVKAKTDKSWKFWGLYVHVCKMEILREAYRLAKANDGSPGIDGVTFEAIEESGVDEFLRKIRSELVSEAYFPMRNRRCEISKGEGKIRVLGIPAIRDRVVQGALKLILEPIFEADFQEGSYGYRPKRTAPQALTRVEIAISQRKTRVIDVDLKAFFDNVRHHLVLKKVAERVKDDHVMRLLKLILKASGKRGVPQGGVISPLISNVYLNEVDKMLERAKRVTTTSAGGYTNLEYARFADDLVILVDGFRRWEWLAKAVYKRLLEELTKLDIQLNAEKTRSVDLTRGEVFQFLGFDIRPKRSPEGKWWAYKTPRSKARKKLLAELKDVFRRYKGHSLQNLIGEINPILRGWVNYYRVGNSSRCFTYVQQWVEKKVRRHIQRARQRKGFGWKQWSSAWLYKNVGLFNDYHIRYYSA